MYATCLFCNSALGSNDHIEHFPVGRRLAFDAATGRLWVVCEKCERWNLSPLETRWEAIEEAERAFRSTKMRVSTNNIGLCRLPDGTELVRVGKPLRPEFAAWRYGDQFLRRRRQFAMHAGAVTSGALLIPVVGMHPEWMQALGTTVFGTAAFVGAVAATVAAARGRSRKFQHSLTIRDAHGELLFLSPANARSATLSPAGHAFEWQLNVPNIEVANTGAVARAIGAEERVLGDRISYLRDDAAKRALATILPHVNNLGGGKQELRDAVELLDDAPNAHYLLHRASVTESVWQQLSRPGTLLERRARLHAMMHPHERRPKPLHLRPSSAKEVTLGSLPSNLRLALEMAMHEDDERRAMQGELVELEHRWRDADAIAKIADAMFLAPIIEEQLDGMRDVQGIN